MAAAVKCQQKITPKAKNNTAAFTLPCCGFCCTDKYNKHIGIHAHNNQQLAFANTIEALSEGVNLIDATYDGMGRGAGNCPMELLLGFLKNPKYKLFPVIKFIEQHMNKLREDGVLWGYGIPYMITGQFNQHPREAIAYSEAHRKDYAEFYKHILDINS